MTDILQNNIIMELYAYTLHLHRLNTLYIYMINDTSSMYKVATASAPVPHNDIKLWRMAGSEGLSLSVLLTSERVLSRRPCTEPSF